MSSQTKGRNLVCDSMMATKENFVKFQAKKTKNAPKQPSKTVKLIFGSNAKDELDSIFCGSEMQINFDPPESEILANFCDRQDCVRHAIASKDWDGEFCSNECAVLHCKSVFADFVSKNISNKS